MLDWRPQIRQEIALSVDFDELLFGGSRGGGKTEAGLAWLAYDTEYPFYRALVIRKNADDLRDWISRARDFYNKIGGQVLGNPPEIRFPNGGIIRTGHLKDENAYQKYQGHQYPKILIEELSQIAREKDYLQLISSCRSPNIEIKPQVFSTTNPDEPGIEWIKGRWNIPDMPDFGKIYEKITTEGKRLVFIPARLEDNPILMAADPNYLKYLDELKEKDFELWDAWRNGNWKGFGMEGSYYRQQIEQAEKDGRITDVPYDDRLEVHTWCDLGIGDSFCILYFQVSGMQWRWIDYDEFEGESLVMAIERMKAKKYRYGNHYAPHDIEIRELGSGMSRLEIGQNNGVNYLIVPRMSVDDGINAVRTRFSTLWIDKTKCDLGLKRLRRYHKEFDNKRGVWKNIPVHDINSHACFTGETLIKTINGEKQIKDIKINDILETPFGKTKVLNQQNTGKKMVYDFMGMRVTANHPFLTIRGFVSLDALRYSDRIYLWKEKQLFMMGLDSVCTRTRLYEKAVFIFWVMRRKAEKLDYIDIFGKNSTAKFLREVIFTIKTAIYLIINWQTWNLLIRNFMPNIIMLGDEENLLLKLPEYMQVSGINQSKAENGILKCQEKLGKEKKQPQKFVKYAMKSIRHIFQNALNSAEIIVKLRPCGEEEVFNLNTENGIFLANGLVVSNSDGLRYWATTGLLKHGVIIQTQQSGGISKYYPDLGF